MLNRVLLMMMRNLNKTPSLLTEPGLSLSPEALGYYLPLKSAVRMTAAQLQDAENRLIRVLCRFRAEALKQQKAPVHSLSLTFPEGDKEGWRWLLLLNAQICLCHYSLKKSAAFESDSDEERGGAASGLTVQLSGKGEQAELCRVLLVFLLPRFCQFRRRAWHQYMRSLRVAAGAEIRVPPVVRDNWRREFYIRWISDIWTNTQTQCGTHIGAREENT